MKQRILSGKWLIGTISVALVAALGLAFVTKGGIVHAEVPDSGLPSSMPTSPDGLTDAQVFALPVFVPDPLVAKASPYVTVDTSTYTATMSRSISGALSYSEINQVNQAIQQYNAQPLEERMGNFQSTDVGPDAACTPGAQCGGGGACKEVITRQSHWWGWTIYVNNCAINDINLALGAGASVATIVALACSICAPIAGSIAAVMGALIVWINWANNHCSARGAFIDHAWWGTSWIDKLC